MKNQIDPNEYQDPRLKNLLELLEPVPPRNATDEVGARQRFMAELDDIFTAAPAQPQSRLPKWLASLLPAQRRPGSSSQRFAFSTLMALIAIFALLFGGAGATALAAQSSIPGDVLYPVKTSLEGAQLTLAADAYAQAQLHLSFAERRLDEIAGLIQAGRSAEIDGAAAEFQRQIEQALEKLGILTANDPARAADLARQITAALSRYAQVLSGLADQAPETVRPALQQALQSTTGQAASGEVELFGVVEAMSASTWTVSGQTLLITPATEIKDSINLGDTVKVHASPNADGAFTAREIELSVAASNENDNAANENDENLNQNSANDDNGLINDNENLDDNENLNENQGDNDNNDNDDSDNDNEDDESSLQDNETRFVGVVESISATSLTVSGLTLIITPQTEMDSSIAAGDSIEVRAVSSANGRLIAVRLRLEGKRSGSQQNDNTNSGEDDSLSNQNDSGNSNSGDDDSGNSNDDSNENNSGSGSGKSGGSNKNDNSSNDNNDNGGHDDNDNG